MCIAIVTKPGRVLDQATLRKCAAANGDGGGFAYVDKDSGNVVIRKGFMKVDDFIPAYEETLEQGHGDANAMLIHFRIATLGRVTADNCHPFLIKNGALIHNGSLWYSSYRGREVEKSDTREFAEMLSGDLTADVLRRCAADMGKEVGDWNKLAFLFNGGDYVIVNEKRGEWIDDAWFSNRNWNYQSSYSRYEEEEWPGSAADWGSHHGRRFN